MHYFAVVWSNLFLILTDLSKKGRAGIKKHILFYQRVSDVIAELFIQHKFESLPVPSNSTTQSDDLTYEKCNVLRYICGYIPRLIKKKLLISSNPLKHDLRERLDELIVDPNEDVAKDASTDWINMRDHGGLVHVNEMMYLMMNST